MEDRNKVTQEEADQIEQQTRDQVDSKQWNEQREWRLTASRFGEICKATARKDSLKLAESILYPPKFTSNATAHGLVHEKTAISRFESVTGRKVSPCGLYIDVEHPFLAATPDGLVDDGKLVEEKCPFKAKNNKILPGQLKNFLFLEERDGEVKLKKRHSYFFQVQGQMKISGKQSCYFITFTLCDFHVEEIEYDDRFYNQEMLPVLREFYNTHYLPLIVKTIATPRSERLQALPIEESHETDSD